METTITKLCKWRDATGGEWEIKSGEYGTFHIRMRLTIGGKVWAINYQMSHRELYYDKSENIEREVDYMIYKFQRQMEASK